MTFALCINMSQPTVSCRLYPNLFPGIAPLGGLQLRIEAAGTLVLQDAEQTDVRDKMKSIMAMKGVVVN